MKLQKTIVWLILVIFNSCQAPPAPEKEQDSAISNTMNMNFESPIVSSEYKYLLAYRYFAYGIMDEGSELTNPLFIDPVIRIRDLFEYKKFNISATGVRIYPGLTKNYSIVPIICLGFDSIVLDETNYIILEAGDYSRAPFYESISLDEASACHKRYVASVYIENVNQPTFGTSSENIRKSRFYNWKQLEMLISQNIDKYDIENPATYENYSLKLETGFVHDILLQRFQNRYALLNINNHRGFTMIWHVLDPNGTPIIDPKARYVNDSTYAGRYLEVGLPCPPKCGELHKLN